MARIYLASSWRNKGQPLVVRALRHRGHEVYDFRNPPHGDAGFAWDDMDPDWQNWSAKEYRDHLQKSPEAAFGYMSDMRGMAWCDTCILLMPCGRSAHLEMGWCAGAGKRTILLLDDGEPELMNLMVDDLCCSFDEVLRVLKHGSSGTRGQSKGGAS